MSRRLSAGLLCGFLAATVPSQGYYYFVHYLNGVNAPEKFDFSALPAHTVTFFVSEDGPSTYSQTDTFNSLLGQIQQAAFHPPVDAGGRTGIVVWLFQNSSSSPPARHRTSSQTKLLL